MLNFPLCLNSALKATDDSIIKSRMRIHYLQHVPFEDLGSMQTVFDNYGATITSTQLYNNETLPELDTFDWLIIMGGPMGVYDKTDYPWLAAEKAFIKQTIEHHKIVLGICLGAQLIAHVLGAQVTSNSHKEIGWFPLKPANAQQNLLSPIFANEINTFHWHGDTFELPAGATLLASSDACAHQGFSLNDRVFGFQFHLETTYDSAQALIEHCPEDLTPGPYIQNGEAILSDKTRFDEINKVMENVLELILKKWL